MITFSSLDLQKRTGDIQIAAARAPVLITHHGKPRAVVLSYEEFCRLKRLAGEETLGSATTLNAQAGKSR